MSDIFPSKVYETCADFGKAYFDDLAARTKSIDYAQLDKVADALAATIARDGFIFICGNGGSAAIANHALCDFQKGARSDTNLKPRMISLAAHTEVNSALSNDISHDNIFSEQLESMARPGDLVWTVSSSGNSENVVRALNVAKSLGLDTVSFTGFTGGRSRELADINVHVDGTNYGVIEDIHMAFIHIVSQFLRMKNMDPALIGQRKF